jgi:hypothetical protein
MIDLSRVRARVGGHNGRNIYMDPVDKPEGERGGGGENMVAVVVGELEEAEELGRWMVEVLNRALEEMRA